MKHVRVPVTVSLPSNLAENFEKLAKAESKTKASCSGRCSRPMSVAAGKNAFLLCNATA